jgi:hypothetical protein
MKYFFLSIVTAVGSLFGVHSQPIQQATTTQTVPQAQIIQSTSTLQTLYKDDWGFSFPIPQGWSSISTTSPVFSSRQFRVIKIVPDSDKVFLRPLTTQSTGTTIKSEDFNSEVIYVVEVRVPKDQMKFPIDLSDASLFRVASYDLVRSMNVRDVASVSIYDKGSLHAPLTGFYTNAKSGSQYVSRVSLVAKDNSNNADGLSLVYLGRNGKFNQETSRNIINSIATDSQKLKPFLDYQISIQPGPINTNSVNVNQSNTYPDPDIRLKEMLSSARVNAELYYSKANSYSGYCSVDKTYNDIKQAINQDPSFKYILNCLDSKENYAISSNLMVGGYWCIDNTGYLGKITAPTTKTYCATAPVNTLNNSTNSVRIPLVEEPPVSSQALTITSPTTGTVLHMGQSYPITWTNPPSSSVTYSVYLENDAEVGTANSYLGSVNSSQQMFTLKVPANIQPGNQFKVYLTQASNGNVVAMGKSFSIVAGI